MGVIPENFSTDTVGMYLRLTPGTHKIRVLGGAIDGQVYWTEDEDGNKKPIRKRMGENIPVGDLTEGSTVKKFLAMPVWNYQTNSVQVWEVTQKSIQTALKRYDSDPDWGDLTGYDLKVTREGEGFDTEYSVTALPAKPAGKEVVAGFELCPVNLEALFEGGDPFAN